MDMGSRGSKSFKHEASQPAHADDGSFKPSSATASPLTGQDVVSVSCCL